MRKWESAKLAESKTKNVLAAELMRDSAVSTANCLDAMTSKILTASQKFKTASARYRDSRSPSPTAPSKPIYSRIFVGGRESPLKNKL